MALGTNDLLLHVYIIESQAWTTKPKIMSSLCVVVKSFGFSFLLFKTEKVMRDTKGQYTVAPYHDCILLSIHSRLLAEPSPCNSCKPRWEWDKQDGQENIDWCQWVNRARGLRCNRNFNPREWWWYIYAWKTPKAISRVHAAGVSGDACTVTMGVLLQGDERWPQARRLLHEWLNSTILSRSFQSCLQTC